MSKRIIEVSTDVYAAIWASRLPGENSEEEVLARVLKVRNSKRSNVEEKPRSSAGGGVYDRRNNVHFDEGFRIFRDYKGERFEAVASSGHWVRSDNGSSFPTLNQLNGSIAAGAENVWNGSWQFLNSEGKAVSIATLRS